MFHVFPAFSLFVLLAIIHWTIFRNCSRFLVECYVARLFCSLTMDLELLLPVRSHEKTMELASVIILNWNKAEDVCDAIASVVKQDYPNIEIIVVDNNSQDNSIERIRTNFSLKQNLFNCPKISVVPQAVM